MLTDRLQLQRLEMKYIIREELALEVRSFVSSYLVPDEYGATFKNLSYPVHSLYLDSDDLRIYWSTINGDKNRHKLRVRFYDRDPGAPVYFEIKRRMNDAILKQRGAVIRGYVSAILSGQRPAPFMMASQGSAKNLAAVQHFCDLMEANHATPKAHVAYEREAWISRENNSIRVTMDRDVRCCPEPTARLVADMVDPVYPFDNPHLLDPPPVAKNVVLELKFSGRYPDWFRDLVQCFGLVQCSAAKYVDGVCVAGEDRFSPLGYSRSGGSNGRALERRNFSLKCYN